MRSALLQHSQNFPSVQHKHLTLANSSPSLRAHMVSQAPYFWLQYLAVGTSFLRNYLLQTDATLDSVRWLFDEGVNLPLFKSPAEDTTVATVSDIWQSPVIAMAVTLGMGATNKGMANHATVHRETLTTKNCSIKMSVSTMLRPRNLNLWLKKTSVDTSNSFRNISY